MEKITEVLDDNPVATLLVLAAIAGGLVALVTGDVTYEVFLERLGIFAGGVGLLGIARAQSGKGIRRESGKRIP